MLILTERDKMRDAAKWADYSPVLPIKRDEECSMATPVQSSQINEDKMNQFLGKVVGDFGAALSSSLAYIGQKLGLYKALAADGPLTPAELAEKTGTTERYVREWL
ncbi:MAG TPA: hypothetical protein VFY34_16535, partial [Pyrinomonadaceae bacterium]|nr:hypothetical protein [Pyrinomonadaceae bacterium]